MSSIIHKFVPNTKITKEHREQMIANWDQCKANAHKVVRAENKYNKFTDAQLNEIVNSYMYYWYVTPVELQ
jgi:hypothetical protein